MTPQEQPDSQARCKTCGGTPPNHKPSVFDRDGIGHPGHKMDSETMQAYADSQAGDETHEKLKMAIMHDFNNLYVPGFTTDWEAQRTIRQLELDVMSLKHTVQAAERLATEARIDEWEQFDKWGEKNAKNGEDIITYIKNRIDTLSATLTKGEKR